MGASMSKPKNSLADHQAAMRGERPWPKRKPKENPPRVAYWEEAGQVSPEDFAKLAEMKIPVNVYQSAPHRKSFTD